MLQSIYIAVMKAISFEQFDVLSAAMSSSLNLAALDAAIEITQEQVQHNAEQYKYALYCVYVALINK